MEYFMIIKKINAYYFHIGKESQIEEINHILNDEGYHTNDNIPIEENEYSCPKM